jgi:Short C-terminal domain
MEQTGPTEAFGEEERRYLAPLLATAFAKARRDEWVVFYLSHPREQRGGPGVREVTSGGFFVEGEQLHFLLANYRYTVSMSSIQEDIREDPLRPAGEGFYELLPSQNQSVRSVKTWDLTEPVRARSLELVLNYQALLSSSDERIPKPERTPSLEERLRTLDRLYREGLITEEEYRLKRQRLLDEL